MNTWGYEMVLCPICSNIMEDYEQPEPVWDNIYDKPIYGLRCTMCNFKLSHTKRVNESN
jgi:hypothetical protein